MKTLYFHKFDLMFKSIKKENVSQKSFVIIKWSVVAVFLGRSWQHLFWDAPFRTFFWDENLLKNFVENVLNTTWQDYVSSEETENLILNVIIGFGVLYVLSFFAALTFRFKNSLKSSLVFLGGIGLVLLAFLLMKEKFYYPVQFLEYSLQFSIPFVLVFYKEDFIQQYLETFLKILIGLTFVAHGLYAVNLYPIPGHFLGMVIEIFNVSTESAIDFLYVAGLLDFLVAVLIFIPKVKKYALMYAAVWGILTALARIVSGFYIDFFWASIHQNLFEVIYRLPHGLIPIMVLVMLKEKSIKN